MRASQFLFKTFSAGKFDSGAWMCLFVRHQVDEKNVSRLAFRPVPGACLPT
jgi:hypothetical protein